MTLNPEQQKAVAHNEGPLLILAGAGSGKTRVLTERLVRLLAEGIVKSEEVLVVTFTNKAAAEIKERVLARLEGKNTNNIPWMGTFHSICVKILRRESQHLGINNHFSIYDGDDQSALVKQAMNELHISQKNFNPKSILAAISSAKNELITAENYMLSAQGHFQETTASVYRRYQSLLRDNTAMDFDDLIMYTVFLLEEVESVRHYYQELFKYVMVDEYQDTNHAQYKLINILASPQNNIAVVGDDDQSIYAWRGANIRNILEFERDYGDVEIIKLEQNYRSTKKILEAGNSVVQGISKRRAKKLWTDNSPGDNLVLYEALDEKDEAYWTVEMIEDLQASGISLEDMVVLYRINAQSRTLEEAFLKAGIPYKIIGNTRFYDRKEIKDMLAYLRIIYNPNDSLSLLRIINVPSRKIGAKTIADMMSLAASTGLEPLPYLLQQVSFLKGGIAKFAELVQAITTYAETHKLTELITFIGEHSGYFRMLDDGSEDGRARLENIKELLTVAAKYEELSPQASLQAFLEEVALIENSTNNQEVLDGGAVTLMTVHSAKGLEFGHVFIVGLEEGIFPHSRSLMNANEIDEERRLAYVAITRAKQKLYLSYTLSRTFFGSRQSALPSRFLNDIATELVEFKTFSHSYQGDDNNPWPKRNSQTKTRRSNNTSGWADFNQDYNETSAFNATPGDTIQHAHFGRGKIISIDADTVVVNFEKHGRKELATEFASLTKL